VRQCFLTLREVSLHSFVKFALNLKQILTNDINFLMITLIVLVKLFTCVSNSFLELSKTSLNDVSANFLIISSFRIFCKVFVFVLFQFLLSISFAIIVCRLNIVRIK